MTEKVKLPVDFLNQFDLGAAQKETLIDFFHEGLNVAQIAEKRGTSKGVISKRMSALYKFFEVNKEQQLISKLVLLYDKEKTDNPKSTKPSGNGEGNRESYQSYTEGAEPDVEKDPVKWLAWLGSRISRDKVSVSEGFEILTQKMERISEIMALDSQYRRKDVIGKIIESLIELIKQIR